MDVLEYLWLRFRLAFRRKPKRNKPLLTVHIKVGMCCMGCERKVHQSIQGMKGVTSYEIDRKLGRLTVIGCVEPRKVLRRVRKKTGKKAVEMWPFVPSTQVDYPHTTGVYDPNAPPGFVLKVTDPEGNPLGRASSTELQAANTFSDDNPEGCTII